MKTAISIPDPIFQAAEAAAQRLAMSRSELYTKAIESFLRVHSDSDITEQLNEIYAVEASGVDAALYDASLRSIGRDAW